MSNDPPSNANPPPLSEDQPKSTPPKDSAGLIAARAILGFVVYLVCGALSLIGGPIGGPGLGPVLLLVVIAIYLAITRKFRGFALGVLIGVGLTLLAAGACFVMLANTHW